MISTTALYPSTASQFTEWTFSLAISQLGSTSWFGRPYLEAIGKWTLRLEGVLGLSIRLTSGFSEANETVFEWGEPTGFGRPDITSIAAIAANGKAWGELRLRLKLGQTGFDSPVKLTGFLAQQVALVLSRAELASDNRILAAELVSLTEELATRKALDRARGVLAERRAISYNEAEELLRQCAARNGRPLRDVANAIATTNGGSFGSLLRQTA